MRLSLSIDEPMCLERQSRLFCSLVNLNEIWQTRRTYTVQIDNPLSTSGFPPCLETVFGYRYDKRYLKYISLRCL